jgi:hypothetical protein
MGGSIQSKKRRRLCRALRSLSCNRFLAAKVLQKELTRHNPSRASTLSAPPRFVSNFVNLASGPVIDSASNLYVGQSGSSNIVEFRSSDGGSMAA